jgi:hypothetical protein
MRPVSRWASFSKVSSERSIRRPVATVGPRSSTLHVADAPVDTRTTFTSVPIGRVRWAQVALGASNHEATPLSDLVSALLTAAAGGTTFSSNVVSGVNGVVVGGEMAGGPAGRVVVVVAGRGVVVVVVDLGLATVVVETGRARVVVVVDDDRARAAWASSASETASTAGSGTGTWGAGARPPAASTRTAVAASSSPFLATSTPAPRTTVHSRAADSVRLLPLVGVSTFPASSAADLDGRTLGRPFSPMQAHPAAGSPNSAAVFAHVACSTSSTGTPFNPATAAPTRVTCAGWFGFPRWGTGAR